MAPDRQTGTRLSVQGTLTATAQPRHRNNRLATRRTHLLTSVINTGKNTHFTLIRATPLHIQPSRDNRTTGHFPSYSSLHRGYSQGLFPFNQPYPQSTEAGCSKHGQVSYRGKGTFLLWRANFPPNGKLALQRRQRRHPSLKSADA